MGKMLEYFKRSKKLTVAVLVFAVVGGASSVAVLAAIPSGNGTVSACYSDIGGGLSVIDTDEGQTCGPLANPLTLVQAGNIIGNSLALNYGDAPVGSPATLLTIPNLGTLQIVCDTGGVFDMIYDNTTDSTVIIDGNEALTAGETSDAVFQQGSNIVTSGSGSSMHAATFYIIGGVFSDTQCSAQAQATVSS